MSIEFDSSYLRLLEEQRQTAGARGERTQQLALLRPRPGDRILDLGCGTGSHARAIAPVVGPGGTVVGVDVAPDAVALAAQLSAETAETDRGLLTFCEADAHRLPFDDGSFDGAICISVLAFCHDPDLAVRELRRVLRPRGRLVVVNSDEDTRAYNGHDRELGRKVMRAAADRTLDPWIGRRLAYLLTVSGFRIAKEDVRVLVERRFRPDQSGYAMAHSLHDYLVRRGGLSEEEYERWLADLERCDHEGSYSYSRTQYTYLAKIPVARPSVPERKAP